MAKTDWKIDEIVIWDTRQADFEERLTYQLSFRVRPPTEQEVANEGEARRPACFTDHRLDYRRCLEATAAVQIELPIGSLDCPDPYPCVVLAGDKPVTVQYSTVLNPYDGLHFAGVNAVVPFRLSAASPGLQWITVTAPAVASVIKAGSNGLATALGAPQFEGPAIGTPVYLNSVTQLDQDMEWTDPSGPRIDADGLRWNYRVDLAPQVARGVRSEVQSSDQLRTFLAGIVAGIAGALMVSLAQGAYRGQTS